MIAWVATIEEAQALCSAFRAAASAMSEDAERWLKYLELTVTDNISNVPLDKPSLNAMYGVRDADSVAQANAAIDAARKGGK